MSETKIWRASNPARHKIKIQRSSFIGSIDAVSNSQQAKRFIEKIRHEFFKATHNCFAYRIDKNQFRFSDDGEPSGTAGKPILGTMERHNLEQTVLVVTRFFGGVKLGTGGLSRAYSQCAEETIQKASIKEIILKKNARIIYPYSFTDNMERLVQKYSGSVIECDYQMEVSADIEIPEEFYNQFIEDILNLGGNQIEVIEE